MQAMARVHRIGQTKPVHVYRLITSSSVEERMLQRADAKLYLDQMVNRGSTAKAQQLDSLNTSELLSMLSFGADRILANQAGQPPSDADLERILDRSQDAAQKAAAALAANKTAADKAAAAAAPAEAQVGITTGEGSSAAPAAAGGTAAAAAVKQEAASVKQEEGQDGEPAAAAAAAAAAGDSSIPIGAGLAEASGGAVLM
ncbi:hypothetical protein COO60DRAFT_109607 [Scenedesmus sp. NREL 46B-D3]|nr:hypothetical protein COO60DRAFT_109607 [Scenedesmus sp. NREL 46B-D3]